MVGGLNQVIKTTNSGTSWDIKTSGSGTFYSLSFPTIVTGYAVGSSGAISKSTDGGNNWAAITSPTSNTLRGTYFVNNSTGWICGYSGTLWKTTDGCTSWIPQNQSTSYSFEKLYFIDANTGVVVGITGTIFKTINGGTGWIQKPSGITTNLYDVCYFSPSSFWSAGSSGKILKSTDLGENWFQQSTPSSSPTISGIHMADINTGYAAGSSGYLWKTTNSGGPPSTPYFIKITSGQIVNDVSSTSQIAWGDYDNDGDQDVVVIPWNDANWNLPYQIEMYQNNGNGTFNRLSNNVISNYITQGIGVAWGDYDNDGRLDLFIARYIGTNNLLFHNEGNGNFTQITSGSIVNDGVDCMSCAWADYDKDGWLDLFVTKNGNNLLYKNNGNGTFTKITSGSIVNDGGNSRGCAWGDYDNDGWLDLFVVNYSVPFNDFLYHNNGNGTFTRILSGPMVTDNAYGSACSWADYDNDGRLDLFVTNNNNFNRLYHNDGNGNFSLSNFAPSQDFGYYYIANWSDFDNDGWIDLFVTCRTGPNLLYKNLNGSGFNKITNEAIGIDGGSSDGCAWSDYNNDGKMDILVTRGSGANYTNLLYQNVYNQGNYITLKLKGCTLNKSGIGARIKLYDGNTLIIREVGGGNYSQNMLWQHFGLGIISNIDSIVVYWTSGNIQKLTNVPVNQILTVDECLIGIINYSIPVKYELKQNYPNPFNPVTQMEYSLLKSGNVKLIIFDLNGKTVSNLVDEYQNYGTYKYDFDGSNLGSGVYFYKIETTDFVDTKKMILIK